MINTMKINYVHQNVQQRIIICTSYVFTITYAGNKNVGTLYNYSFANKIDILH